MKPEDFFSQKLVLENQQILLRPLALSDEDPLYPIAIDPNLWEVGMTTIRNRVELQNYLQEALRDREKQAAYPFLILVPKTKEPIGTTRFYDISFEHKRLSIGWTWIGKKYRGTGINKACKYELLRYAFEELGWNRVEFKVDVLNTRSRKAIAKIGATEEGILRRHMITYTGRVRDTVYCSIIKEEWPRIKQEIFSDVHSS